MIGQPGEWLLVKGIAAGILVAAPIGPVNVLCAARSIARGWRAGMVSGLGAAAADAVFAAIAALGLGLVMDFLTAHRAALSLAGAAFLFVYGLRTLIARPPAPDGGADGDGAEDAGDAASAFLLTLAYPITVFSFVGVYVAFGIQADSRVDAGDAQLVAGVFLGALVWWLAVATAASRLRTRFAGGGFVWANRVAGATILAFAAALLVQALA